MYTRLAPAGFTAGPSQGLLSAADVLGSVVMWWLSERILCLPLTADTENLTCTANLRGPELNHSMILSAL